MVRRLSFLVVFSVTLGLVPRAEAQEWYEFYEKGLRTLQQKRGAMAAGLFERAIRRQPTPGEDVPTYGTNRIARYYPYLRLAEALAMSGEMEGARRALKRSEASGREPAAERAFVSKLINADSRGGLDGLPMRNRPRTPITSLPAPSSLPTLPQGEAQPVETRAATSSSPPSAEAGLRLTPADAQSEASLRDHRGILEITTSPPGADVYLDGEFIGRSDDAGRLVKREVPLGSHELRVGGVGGFVERRERVQVAAQTQRIVMLDRQAQKVDPSPLISSPAFVILAATLALGLAGVLVIRSRRPPGPPGETTALRPAGPDAPAETGLIPQAPASGGALFGEYQLLEPLGKGGMASVFRARRRGEEVALKRPLASFLSQTEFLERFVREAEIGRTLNHPNIIRIFEKGRVGDVPYFTMELVDGETLHAMARREGALSPMQACNIVKQVAEGLDYSHLKGVVHRDLKPSNIMILKSGAVKVMDFGIARSSRFDGLTLTGAFLGTPEYIAPETAEGGRTDARSDLYSLGVVFYEILTGVRPFVGDTPFATLKKICSEPPTPPSAVRNCPAELEAIVLKLLRKNPLERHASAEELLNEINDYINTAA